MVSSGSLRSPCIHLFIPRGVFPPPPILPLSLSPKNILLPLDRVLPSCPSAGLPTDFCREDEPFFPAGSEDISLFSHSFFISSRYTASFPSLPLHSIAICGSSLFSLFNGAPFYLEVCNMFSFFFCPVPFIYFRPFPLSPHAFRVLASSLSPRCFGDA